MSAHRHLLRQAGRFVVTGVLATALHALTVVAMVTLMTPAPSQVVANGAAFVLANVFSYVTNSLWSFAAPLHGKNYAKFLAVSGIGFVGTLLVAWVAEGLGLTPAAGIALVVCVMTPISFTLHRSWTFRGAVG